MLSCSEREFPSIRHHELKDLTATLLSNVCDDICHKPELQLATSEVMVNRTAKITKDTWLDVALSRLWGGRYERSFIDGKFSKKDTLSNNNISTQRCYRKHEMEKKRVYEQGIWEIKCDTFTCFLSQWWICQGSNHILQAFGLLLC